MTNYDNSNRGAIWRNKDKQQDSHPDFKGSINVTGVDYWISGWQRKEGDNPKAPVIRFSINPKEETHQQGMEQTQQVMNQQIEPQGQEAQQFDDDIPF